MANQIQTIKDHSDVAQWQYVPSKRNGCKSQTKQQFLYSLDPFMGEDQVLLVRGRLKNSGLNSSCIHPILLPKNGMLLSFL